MVPRRVLPALLPALLLLGVLGTVTRTEPQEPAAGAKDVATAEEVQARCGTVCHKLPSPEILPRSAWRDELVRMMLISEGVPEPAGASSFIPLPPDWLRLLRYYEANAPARLPDPEPWPGVTGKPLAFTRRSVPAPGLSGAIAIANLRLLDLDRDGALDIVASEMRTGPVLAGLAANGHAMEPIARLAHPSHIEPVDLDGDGLEDLLVADLGSFQPADHDNGAVYWLRRSKDGKYTTIQLAKGLARTADARAADFDGDGDLDIVLGIFGWRTTGNVTILENRTKDWKSPTFVPTVVDKRTGAIHTPVVDLNGDGRPDFVVLFA
ncbi:MAG TPA: VCBS repeat-containing protein, partial [Vicinamibacterales bacterium]